MEQKILDRLAKISRETYFLGWKKVSSGYWPVHCRDEGFELYSLNELIDILRKESFYEVDCYGKVQLWVK